MSDVLVTALLATLAGWFLCGILGAACQWRVGVNSVRALFGSARAALILPLVGMLTVVIAMTALHRSVSLVNTSSNLTGDADGCVHWSDHLADVGFGLAPLFVMGMTIAFLGNVAIRFLRDAKFHRRLVAGIDRRATRALRALIGECPAQGELYVASNIEDSGPFATVAGGRPIIFVPLSSMLDKDETRAVVLHERSHHARGHLRRRRWFEGSLAILLPPFLLRPVKLYAREEEEWEADGDAARVLGSRSLVARAVLHAAERASVAARAHPTLAFVAERWGLDLRIHRLLHDMAPIPYRMGRSVVLCTILGVLTFSALWSRPEVSIWLFCQAEQVLGVSCAT